MFILQPEDWIFHTLEPLSIMTSLEILTRTHTGLVEPGEPVNIIFFSVKMTMHLMID